MLSPTRPATRPTTRRAVLGCAAAAGAALAWPGARAQAAYEAKPWPPGQPLPPVEAQDLSGKTWRLADLRGRAVVLNFWATWCEPCRAEMPTLQQMAEFYGPDRLVVLAMNYKEPAPKAAQFARTTGLTLPVLLDPSGDITRSFDVRVFPSTMLIGADGKPRMRIRGEVDWTGREAAAVIEPLFRRS